MQARTATLPARPWAFVAVALWFVCTAALAAGWTDGTGRPNGNAHEALALLAAAADQGLRATDYSAAALADTAARLRAAPDPAEHDVLAFDRALTTQMQRYLRNLHTGRADPRAAGFRVASRRDEHDFAALLEQAVAVRRVQQLAEELAPALATYRSLRTMLARYRALANDAALAAWTPGPTLRPGLPHEGLAALQRRLAALGDLPAGSDAGALYEGALVEGVRRFQSRHGLEPDGVLGPSTQAARQVPLDRRVRQIELAMERLRWLPHLEGERFVAVNIPMFRLWAVTPGNGPPRSMGVIVGRALNTQTPVFIEQMRHVIFRPYWNVPRSIVRNELLPLIERDTAYLPRHDMEIVRGPGDDAQPVEPSAANLALLRQGVLRLRQRPGPRNSLRLVKFVFPNDANVYLHGTPAQSLFGRPRRDFSHGCVRVEDPVALAEWVLADQPRWTHERIMAAMNGDRTITVRLARPLPVVLYYVTAAVLEDGVIHFADDVYGHDARLERALAR